MKKIILFASILALATACNSGSKPSQSQSAQNKPVQSQSVQNQLNQNQSAQNNSDSVPTEQEVGDATPIPIVLQAGLYKDTKTFNFNGLTITCPWSNSFIKKQNGAVITISNNNGSFTIIGPNKGELESVLSQSGGSLTQAQMQKLIGKFGDSNANFAYFIYSLTPVSVGRAPQNLQNFLNTLLALKKTVVTALPIRVFKTSNIKGFEFGEFGKTGIGDFYPASNDKRYGFIERGLSQSEIDFILENIK